MDSKRLALALVDRGFDIERHYERYPHPVPADEVWVPEVAREGKLVLTADRGGDRRILDILASTLCPAVLVSQKTVITLDKFVDRFCDVAKRIELALEREGLVFWLNYNDIDASRHSDLSTRYKVLGNGKLRLKPPRT